jgi:dienelactone hydrolase
MRLFQETTLEIDLQTPDQLKKIYLRTFAHGKKLAADKEHPVTIDSEVIDDALAAVKAARNWPEVDAGRVYVLGHSLGGTAAPAIAIRDGRLAGIILMAAAARPPDKMAIDQFTYMRDHDPV